MHGWLDPYIEELTVGQIRVIETLPSIKRFRSDPCYLEEYMCIETGVGTGTVWEYGRNIFSTESEAQAGVIAHQQAAYKQRAARDHEDERHVCPMALDLIERAITLWSNPGDVIFDPFSGVGSTGYQAIKMGRKFVGSELKQSYFAQACKNIESAKSSQTALF